MFQGIRPQHMDVHRFWRQSVLRGLAAQETAHTCRAQSPQRLFLEGLLADIGHLVMYQVVPDMAERAMMRAEMERRPLHEVEREVVGCHYAQVGGALLGEWKLPRVFSDAIAAQIHPDLICSEMAADAAILHFVRVLVDGMLKKQADVEIARQVDPFVWASIDLDATDIGAIRAVAEEHLSEVEAIFFPQLQAAA
jgi:HD-like signal output (HDOD) protein